MRSSDRLSWRLAAVGVAIVLAVLASAMALRAYDAHLRIERVTSTARAEHGGDPVESLIAYVESNRHSPADKSLAIWKLGRLGDARALPLLERLRTGQPCDHARFVCQREIDKALARLASREPRGRY